MLAKGQRPVIGRLSELLVARCRPAFLDVGSTSPTSHFDLNLMLSPTPRGNHKNYGGGTGTGTGTGTGGVGLGIVAALDNTSAATRGREVLVKHAVCSPKSDSRRSAPIPVGFGKHLDSFTPDHEEDLESSEENYTIVITRGPHKSSTRVYYDGGEYDPSPSGLFGRTDGGTSRKSPPTTPTDQVPVHPTPDFLRSCHLCGKNLEGSDIYMYSEKAFCSPDCRSKQMTKDEMKERCGSEASRSAEVSNSPYNSGQIFSMGILAI